MLLNKGHDMLSRSAHRNSGSGSSDTRNLQRDLDKIQQQWDRLRKDTVERHTRLQTCMVRKHCNCGTLCCVIKLKQTEMLVHKYEVDWLIRLSYWMQAGSDPDRAKNWSLCYHDQFGSGANPSNHPPIQFIPGLKGPYHEADQLTFT